MSKPTQAKNTPAAETIAELRTALRAAPTDVHLALRVAVRLEELGDSAGVLHLLRPFGELASHEPRVWLHMSRAVMLMDGDAKLAFRLLNRARSVALDDFDALLDVGQTQIACGMLDEGAATLLSAALLRPTDVQPHRLLARALSRHDRAEEALSCWNTMLEVAPDDEEAIRATVDIMLQTQPIANAVAALRRAVTAFPTDLHLAARYGCALRAAEQFEQSCTVFDGILEAQPTLTIIRMHRARSLYECGRYAEARADAELVLKEDRRSADALAVLGTILAALDETELAERHLRAALRLQPGHAVAEANLGQLLARKGEVEQARELLSSAASESGYIGAQLAAVWSGGEVDMEKLLSMVGSGTLTSRNEMQARIALAKMHERRGEYDQAFFQAEAGNALKRVTFNPDAHRRMIDALCERFTGPPSSVGGHLSQVPVFVVGLPRSGTSLVTQMLSAHPDIASAGELPTVPTLMHQMASNLGASKPYPLCAPAAGDAAWETLAYQYLDAYPDAASGASRVVDKLPANFLHLGAIQRMLPRATVIHCLRDPADIAISCWMTPFLGEQLPWSYDLEHIAAYIRAHDRVTSHWAHVAGVNVVTVRYEELVREPEQEMRKLLAAVDMPWNPVCMNPQASESEVNTASVWQVRESLYTSSIGRARLYSKWLAPYSDLFSHLAEEEHAA
jgi:Flp pilus assembly protein TadD